MVLIFLLPMIGQAPAGPLDGFLVNYTEMRVGIDFVHETGHIDRAALAKLRSWKDGDPGFVRNPSVQRVYGRWECDGKAEHMVCRPEDIQDIPTETTKSGQTISSRKLAIEALSDGELAAWHIDEGPHGRVLQLAVAKRVPILRNGPFYWFSTEPFPDLLAKEHPNETPKTTRATLGGHAVEVATYEKVAPSYWQQTCIAYDPSVGYLPRFTRVSGQSRMGEKTIDTAMEMYLVEARACSAGGFVPMEWYQVRYRVGNFQAWSDRPGPDPSALTPYVDKSYAQHFKVVKFADLSQPVRLDPSKIINSVGGVGGHAAVTGPPRPLSLNDLKGILGRKKLTEPTVFNATKIDTGELRDFDHTPRRNWLLDIASVIVGVVVVGLAIRFWRRSRALMILIGLAILPGCGRVESKSEPVTRLDAAFSRPQVLYSPGDAIDMTLVVRNTGYEAVKLIGINGGCSCRKVDKSTLPRVLKPGASIDVAVNLQDRRQYGPQSIVFMMETDHGQIGCPTTVQTLPTHQLTPETVGLSGIYEDDGDEDAGVFEVVHRAIFKAGEVRQAARLVVPTAFTSIPGESRSGKVAGQEGYEFEEVTYRLTLKDRSPGTHKQVIILRGYGDRIILETPVLWKRTSFLSATPERLSMGSRAVRAFLRCADEEVELTKILSTPTGIKAVISSPRELTVTLEPEAPGVINGVIEVATTSEGHPPLRVPVVRYAPAVASASTPK